MSSRRGTVLVEVVISILVIAAAVSGLAGALLAAAGAPRQAEVREQAAAHVAGLMEELRFYVTPEPLPDPAAPDGGNGGHDWRIRGDACGCWALQEGVHDVTGRLPAPFLEAWNARMRYTVAVVAVNGEELRRATVSLDWSPPP
ncbi:MAG: hypothetical protein PHF00_06905 [Elusimicrobia bacterium]|nr:hypothetical protein [Elusimicrobiota bacterium]